jgi:hypothetical protein
MQLKSAVLKRTRHKLDVKSIAWCPALPNIDLLIKVTDEYTVQGVPKYPKPLKQRTARIRTPQHRTERKDA